MTDRDYNNRIFEDTAIELGGMKATDVIFNRCTFVFTTEELCAEFVAALNGADAAQAIRDLKGE